MKILAIYGHKRVYVINTFYAVSPNIYTPNSMCTILDGNGKMLNVEMKDLTIIDNDYTIKEN